MKRQEDNGVISFDPSANKISKEVADSDERYKFDTYDGQVCMNENCVLPKPVGRRYIFGLNPTGLLPSQAVYISKGMEIQLPALQLD